MKLRSALATIALLALAAPSFAGGHATIRVGALPTPLVAGRDVPVTFTVHDAVSSPLNDLKPVLVLQSGARTVKLGARRAKAAGAYEARVKFPAAGEWTLTVESGYCGNTAVVRGLAVADEKVAAKSASR